MPRFSTSQYTANADPEPLSCLSASFFYPLDWEKIHFLEALLRYRRIVPTSPALAVAAVTASTAVDTAPEHTRDYDFQTAWAAPGDGQWIQYDLGSLQTVRKVAIAWDKGDERSTGFAIHVSRDGARWTPVFAGFSCGLTSAPETYDFPDILARYVRLVGHGNVLMENSLAEVRIF